MTSPRSCLPDSLLVRGAIADKPGAFETLVLRYQRKAYAIAWAFGIAADSVDDVVQEAFLKALGSLPKLRAPAAFESWFLQIVRNVCRKQYRAAKENNLHPTDDLNTLYAPSTESETLKELTAHVADQIQRLPQSLRETVLLYYFEGESVRQVARTLALSVPAVKARLKRARDLLRERLWREFEEQIRELVPSTREWKTRGRTLALVLTTLAMPASKSMLAAEGSSSAVASPAITAASQTASVSVASTAASIGGTIMAKKALVTASAAALLIVGTGSVVKLTTPTMDEDRAMQEYDLIERHKLDELSTQLRAVIEELNEENAGLGRERDEMVSRNRALEDTLRQLRAQPAPVESPDDPTAAEEPADAPVPPELAKLAQYDADMLGEMKLDAFLELAHETLFTDETSIELEAELVRAWGIFQANYKATETHKNLLVELLMEQALEEGDYEVVPAGEPYVGQGGIRAITMSTRLADGQTGVVVLKADEHPEIHGFDRARENAKSDLVQTMIRLGRRFEYLPE